MGKLINLDDYRRSAWNLPSVIKDAKELRQKKREEERQATNKRLTKHLTGGKSDDKSK